MSLVAGAVTVLYIWAVFWRGVDLLRNGEEMQASEIPSQLYSETFLSGLHVCVEHNPPTVIAIFSFQPPSDCVQGQDYNYTINVWTGGNVMKKGKQARPFAASGCSALKIPVENLERDVLYSANIFASSGGLTVRSQTIQFRTNCVQLAAVVVGERHMKIVCRFAKGSTAKGCHIEIEYENSYTSTKLHQNSLNVPMEDATLESSTCLELKSLGRVRVYDWLEDGTVGSIAVTPIFKEGSDSVCDLASKQSIADAGRIALFYASAALMAAGIIAITVGMLCKLGRLNSHFKKYSHAPIEDVEDN